MTSVSADFELTAVEVAEAIGGLVGDSTIRNWVTTGRIPATYYWRSPTGRMLFRRKVVAFILAGGSALAQPVAPRPKPAKVKPVRWDGAA